ncbi:MAG: hypothetical protein ACOYB3_00025 [Azonexus sp.]
MRTTFISLIAAVALLAGCASQNTVLVATGTVIGVEIGQNPSTGMYHAKMGYNRGELALVPSTNMYTPDVITELRYNGFFSTGADSGIYQRLAVGSIAVSQPGAMAMFLKDSSGNISSNTAAALKSLASIPTVNTTTTTSLVKIAALYKTAPDKGPWNQVANANGYPSFAAFLIDPKLTPEKVISVRDGLHRANLIPNQAE